MFDDDDKKSEGGEDEILSPAVLEAEEVDIIDVPGDELGGLDLGDGEEEDEVFGVHGEDEDDSADISGNAW
jgi:hypothetical protein